MTKKILAFLMVIIICSFLIGCNNMDEEKYKHDLSSYLADDYHYYEVLLDEKDSRCVDIPFIIENNQRISAYLMEGKVLTFEGINIQDLEIEVNDIYSFGLDGVWQFNVITIILEIRLKSAKAFEDKHINKLFFNIDDQEVMIESNIHIKDKKRFGISRDLFEQDQSNEQSNGYSIGLYPYNTDMIIDKGCEDDVIINFISFWINNIEDFMFNKYDSQWNLIFSEPCSNLDINIFCEKGESFEGKWLTDPEPNKIFYGREIIIDYKLVDDGNDYISTSLLTYRNNTALTFDDLFMKKHLFS